MIENINYVFIVAIVLVVIVLTNSISKIIYSLVKNYSDKLLFLPGAISTVVMVITLIPYIMNNEDIVTINAITVTAFILQIILCFAVGYFKIKKLYEK
jgi:hypothetical protein